MIKVSSRKAGYCYFIYRADGTFKVGRTKDPENRMRSHFQAARKDENPNIEEVWISELLDDARTHEELVLSELTKNGIPLAEGKEIFRGLPKSQARVFWANFFTEPFIFEGRPIDLKHMALTCGITVEISSEARPRMVLTGAEVRLARGATNMSIKELANALGIKAARLKRIESTNGTYMKTTVGTANAITEYLTSAISEHGYTFKYGGVVRLSELPEAE